VVYLYEASHGVSGLTCPDDSQNGCAVSVNVILTSLGLVATFLSMAAGQCAETLNAPAACATDIAAVIALLADIALSGSGFGPECAQSKKPSPMQHLAEKMKALKSKAAEEAEDSEDSEKDKSFDLAKFLSARRDKANAKVAFNFRKAQCSFDVMNAAGFFVRALVLIADAEANCENPRACGLDLTAMIASFSLAASGMSFAASDCAPIGNPQAKCAALVTNLVGGVSFFGVFAASAETDCDAAFLSGGSSGSTDEASS